MTRGSMLEVLGADFMRTAKAKGLRDREVVVKHGLRNAMLPVVTLIGLDFGTSIGSAVLTETVFSWGGLGFYIADAVVRRDLPVLLGLTTVVVLAYALINLLVDISYAWFDPRVRLGEGRLEVSAVPPDCPRRGRPPPLAAAWLSIRRRPEAAARPASPTSGLPPRRGGSSGAATARTRWRWWPWSCSCCW